MESRGVSTRIQNEKSKKKKKESPLIFHYYVIFFGLIISNNYKKLSKHLYHYVFPFQTYYTPVLDIAPKEETKTKKRIKGFIMRSLGREKPTEYVCVCAGFICMNFCWQYVVRRHCTTPWLRYDPTKLTPLSPKPLSLYLHTHIYIYVSTPRKKSSDTGGSHWGVNVM